MLALIPPTLFLAAVAAVAVGVVLWKRRQHDRYYDAVIERIRDRFPTLDEPIVEDTVPLRSPPGRVAVRSEGIHLSLDGNPPAHVVVPWSDVEHVLPKGNGDVRVHVAGVGDLSVAGVASRQIWAITNEARTGRPSPTLASA